jgi:hypothetical protein
MDFSQQRVVLGCLTGLAIALLLVGIVSGTFLRHIVQILPIAMAAGVLTRRPDWGAYAAVPIFVFWIFIVVMIWLFLLGLSQVANGHYTAIEVISTSLIAGFSGAGVIKSIPLGRSLPVIRRVFTVILFAVVQVAAMWVSFLRPIANR